jgi:hypothetical protein
MAGPDGSPRTAGAAWSRWLPTPVPVAAAATAGGFAVYFCSLVLETDMYRSIPPGVWLALGRDLSDGVFYRPLVSEIGFGGTRYFPLHFTTIAAFLAAGLAPLTAWALSAALSLAMVSSGLFAVARRLGVPASHGMLLAVCGTVPYFIQESLFELRCDVLAAGLNIWGVALVLDAWTRPREPTRLAAAGLCFTLAFATKVTSLAVPAAAVFALAVTGSRAKALRLGFGVAGGSAAVLGGTLILSGGRALENWRASMFAGLDAGSTLQALLAGTFVERALYSNFLAVLLIATLAALAGAWWLSGNEAGSQNGGSWTFAALLFLAVTAATIVTLSSPGAVASNHAVEWIEVSLVVLVLAAYRAPQMRRAVSLLLVLLTLWAGAQDVVQARTFAARPGATDRADVRDALVERLRVLPGPILAESAIWPVLAGKPAVVIDAFMFRLVAESHPDLRENLLGRIERREFSAVVLDNDPVTTRGRRWYETTAFGSAVVDQILASYRLDSQPDPDTFVYVPRSE